MIYHPDDCDMHFGPCPTDAEVDELRALVASLRPEPCPASASEADVATVAKRKGQRLREIVSADEEVALCHMGADRSIS
jgi:hypothetical protein